MEETEKSTLQEQDQEFDPLMANFDILDINLHKTRALADLLETCRPDDLHGNTLKSVGGILFVLLNEAHESLEKVMEISRMRAK